jgi:peptidyl-dipeptidase Dcp
MLDHDSRKWFMDNGGLTRKNGDHYRATVLSKGGTMDYFDMFRTFAGRAPDIQPLLEARGLTGGTAAPASPSDDGGAAKTTTPGNK